MERMFSEGTTSSISTLERISSKQRKWNVASGKSSRAFRSAGYATTIVPISAS